MIKENPVWKLDENTFQRNVHIVFENIPVWWIVRLVSPWFYLYVNIWINNSRDYRIAIYYYYNKVVIQLTLTYKLYENKLFKVPVYIIKHVKHFTKDTFLGINLLHTFFQGKIPRLTYAGDMVAKFFKDEKVS